MQAEHDKQEHNKEITNAINEANKKESKVSELVYTQEMYGNAVPPEIGSIVKLMTSGEGGSRTIDFEGKEVTIIGKATTENGRLALTFSHPIKGIGCCMFFKNGFFYPLKTAEEIELEAANKKQVDSLVGKYDESNRALIERMQKNGDLVNPLPLKS